jgi:CheY-like chemotaxis protein
MGGDIRLDSTAGQGSRFRVRVYLPAIEGTPRDDASRQVIAYRGALRRLLIVDDEAAHRAVLRELLAPLGFEIREAALASECLAHLDSEPFDAVLLDINLPDADGWSVARAIAARAGVSTPVLIVSGNVHDNTAALRAGSTVAGFVAKPVNESDLLEALRTTLRLEWLAIPGGDTHQPLPDLDPELARELLSLSAQGRDRALLARLAEAAEESAGMAHWSRRLAGLLARDRQALHDTLGDSIRRPTGASIDG